MGHFPDFGEKIEKFEGNLGFGVPEAKKIRLRRAKWNKSSVFRSKTVKIPPKILEIPIFFRLAKK